MVEAEAAHRHGQPYECGVGRAHGKEANKRAVAVGRVGLDGSIVDVRASGTGATLRRVAFDANGAERAKGAIWRGCRGDLHMPPASLYVEIGAGIEMQSPISGGRERELSVELAPAFEERPPLDAAWVVAAQ